MEDFADITHSFPPFAFFTRREAWMNLKLLRFEGKRESRVQLRTDEDWSLVREKERGRGERWHLRVLLRTTHTFWGWNTLKWEFSGAVKRLWSQPCMVSVWQVRVVFQILHGCEAISDANPGIVADDLLRYDHVQNERRSEKRTMKSAPTSKFLAERNAPSPPPSHKRTRDSREKLEMSEMQE